MLFRSARGVAASVAAVFVAELFVFVAVSGRIGLFTTAVITLAASVVGVGRLVRIAPAAIARSFQDLADAAVGGPSPGPSVDLAVAGRALQVAAALLLAVPGLLTGAIGSVLFVGPVRRLLAPSLGSRLSGLLPAGALDGRSFVYRRAPARDVVDATATVKGPRPPSGVVGRPCTSPGATARAAVTTGP